jgi:PAS domain S-box-containing protein
MWVLTPVLLALLFATDRWFSTTIHISLYYLAALILIILAPRRRDKLILAGLCTVLTVFDYLTSLTHPDKSAWLQVFAHCLAIFILWIVTALELRRRSSQLELSDSEERYRTLYHGTPSMYFSVDKKGIVRSVNEFGAAQLGYRLGELIGGSVFEIFDGADREAARTAFTRAFEQPDSVHHWEFRKQRKDGAVVWVREWARIIKDDLGDDLALIVCEDITERKRAEDALRQTENVANERLARLRAVYDSAPVALAFVDRELRYVSVNAALAKMNGRAPEEHFGKTLREVVPTLAPKVENRYRSVIETGQPLLEVEDRSIIVANPTERRFWLSSYYPVTDDAGRVLGVNIVARDITRRKESEEDALFLLDLNECIHFAADPEELPWAIAVALGEHLGADRAAFVEINQPDDCFTVHRDYRRNAPSLVGTYRLSAFGSEIGQQVKAGHNIIIENAFEDRRTTDHAASYRNFGVSALIAAPLLSDGACVSALVMASEAPRSWTEREIKLVNTVAERTWLAVEKLRLDTALREADRRKDEFLATLAHELRNPLSLIHNVVELLQRPGVTDGEIRRGRAIIQKQAEYLTRLTDDLFDISRITRDKIELHYEDLNLPEVLHAAIESSQPLIDNQAHRLTVEFGGRPVYVRGDRVRLTQIFMNLLNNAAKYTPRKGHIQMHLESKDDRAVITVRDNGAGIPAQSLPHLFDMFYQVDRTYAHAEGGLGLGLTLVRRLVEMHGGLVEVKSEGINCGSEFTVRLPALQHVEQPPEPKVSAPIRRPKTKLGRRILIADDFPQSAETLAKLLQESGNEVEIAEDGIKALETAARFCPDIALLDIAMPRLNGYDTARRIREEPWGKQMILIAFTGWGQGRDRRRSQEAGFDFHLTKPIRYEALLEIMQNLSHERRAG